MNSGIKKAEAEWLLLFLVLLPRSTSCAWNATKPETQAADAARRSRAVSASFPIALKIIGKSIRNHDDK